jgi:hypothetical protein
MKKRKPGFVFKSLVLFFLVAYVIGTVANIMLIPSYVPTFSQTAASSVITPNRRAQFGDFNVISFLQVFDKSTIDSNSPDRSNFTPGILDLYFNSPLAKAMQLPALTKNHPLYNFRYAYISLCTFRI